MPTNLTPEQWEFVAQRCKDRVEANDSALITLVAKAESIWAPLTLEDIHIIKEKVVKGGQYAATPFSDEFFISRNHQYELNENIKNTNLAIQNLVNNILPNNFQSQENLTKWSLRLAGASIIFIAATVILQILNKVPRELKDLKLEVQKTSKTLKSIQPSLKEINSSIQKATTDTFLVKKKK